MIFDKRLDIVRDTTIILGWEGIIVNRGNANGEMIKMHIEEQYKRDCMEGGK